MGKKIFQTAKEAFLFAKSLAMESRTLVKPFSLNGKWFIESEHIKDDIDYDSSYLEIEKKLKIELLNNEDVDNLIDIVTTNLKLIQIENVNNSNLEEESKNFLLGLNKILYALERLSVYISDIHKVRTKEFALYMAYEFSEIADELGQYRTANLSKRFKMTMLQDSNKLPNDLAVNYDAQKTNMIAALEGTKGKCKKQNCFGRYVVRESDRGYFWGCSEFPNCWTRINFSKEEEAKLA